MITNAVARRCGISGLLVAICLALAAGWVLPARAAEAVPPVQELRVQGATDLMTQGLLALASDADEAFPTLPTEQLPAWIARHRAATAISPFGGHYWLLARVRYDGAGERSWVFDPNNSLMEQVRLQLRGSDGSVQTLEAGYIGPREYTLHYGRHVVVHPGVTYTALLRVDSRYFASEPRFAFVEASRYHDKVLRENTVVVGSLGAMLALALFNFFIFLLTRTLSHFYYALQLGLSVWAWAMTFQLPTELFGWHHLRLHYVPFFLLPAVASLFCIDFLSLARRHPRLYRLHCGIVVAGVLLSPVAVFALPYAHVTATVLISVWLLLTLTSGVLSLRAGYRPARFFVLAFSALALPAVIILPGNLGLIVHVVEDAQVLTLFGSAVEALLQAFALADRIRLLSQEKDSVARQLSQALDVAHTDAMTGLGNRYAFDLMIERRGVVDLQPDEQPYLLAIVDVDGLKQVNDQLGHNRGDVLIRNVGLGLSKLQSAETRCYRIGGDEFAILLPRGHEQNLREHLLRMEAELRALGFEQAGISHGCAHWEPGCDLLELLNRADQTMYLHKARRKEERRLSQIEGDLTSPTRLE